MERSNVSADAINLLSAVHEADGGGVHLPSGKEALKNIDVILSRDAPWSAASKGHYARRRIERYHVRWLDGTEGDLYLLTEGYFEGYSLDIYGSMEAAESARDAQDAAWARYVQERAQE